MHVCEEALTRGVYAQAIRPPTVPAGTSRLRLALMATHTPDELGRAAQALAEAVRATGADLSRPVATADEPADPERQPVARAA
jgi:glycine C-acetyltransferase/8-amino-7-oxononanoate synthase